MHPQKSHAKPKEDIDPNAPKHQWAPDIQWVKNPDWTHTLIAYLGNHVASCLWLFSDSTADAAKASWPKLTAKDSKAQQFSILAKHVFTNKPGQSLLYLQNPGRYSTAVETCLWWSPPFHVFVPANKFSKPQIQVHGPFKGDWKHWSRSQSCQYHQREPSCKYFW